MYATSLMRWATAAEFPSAFASSSMHMRQSLCPMAVSDSAAFVASQVSSSRRSGRPLTDVAASRQVVFPFEDGPSRCKPQLSNLVKRSRGAAKANAIESTSREECAAGSATWRFQSPSVPFLPKHATRPACPPWNRITRAPCREGRFGRTKASPCQPTLATTKRCSFGLDPRRWLWISVATARSCGSL